MHSPTFLSARVSWLERDSSSHHPIMVIAASFEALLLRLFLMIPDTATVARVEFDLRALEEAYEAGWFETDRDAETLSRRQSPLFRRISRRGPAFLVWKRRRGEVFAPEDWIHLSLTGELPKMLI